MPKETNPLNSLSDAMVDAVEKAAAATVMVNACCRFRQRIAYATNLILTADHVVERTKTSGSTARWQRAGCQPGGTRPGQRPGRAAAGTQRGSNCRGCTG
jgi:hypothetical protein